MTTSSRSAVDPPGRPLWLASEEKRVREGWTKIQLAARAGIGRMTYDRLESQENPPHARTVKRLAEAIGMPYVEAVRLSGLVDSPDTDDHPEPTDYEIISALVTAPPKKRVPLAVTSETRNAVQTLRKQAREADLSLGEFLVAARLAEREELDSTAQSLIHLLTRLNNG